MATVGVKGLIAECQCVLCMRLTLSWATDDILRRSELRTSELSADLCSVDWHSVEINVKVVVDGIRTIREDFLQRNLSRRPVHAAFFWVRLVLQVEVEVCRV